MVGWPNMYTHVSQHNSVQHVKTVVISLHGCSICFLIYRMVRNSELTTHKTVHYMYTMSLDPSDIASPLSLSWFCQARVYCNSLQLNPGALVSSLFTHLVEKTPPTKGKPEMSPVDPCLTILRQMSMPLRN